MMKKVQIYKNQNYKKLAIWTSEPYKTKHTKKVQRNKNTKKTLCNGHHVIKLVKNEYLWTMCEKKGKLTSQMMGARKKQGTSCHWIPSLYLSCNM